MSEDWEVKRERIRAEAAKLGHVPTVREAGYMSDECTCSCGWKSRAYWDGAEYAYDEWQKHAGEAMATGQAHLPLAVPKGAPEPF